MGIENYSIWDTVKKNIYEKTIKEIRKAAEECNGNVSNVLEFSLNAVCDVTHSVAGTFWYYDVNDTQCIVAKAVRGGADLSAIRLQPGEGIAGKVIKEGQGYKNYDVRDDFNWSSKTDSMTSFATKSMICVPMTINDYTFGCMQLINKTDDSYFDDDDYQIVVEFVDSICSVIDEYNIFPEIKESENAVVMFIKINNYDEICEHLQPKANIELLNMFYKDLSSKIINNKGTVDCCYYDQIIGYWFDRKNSSVDISSSTYKTVKEVLQAADNLNKIAYGYFIFNVDISLGVSYGSVYKQNIGYGKSTIRTIVGSAVSRARSIQTYAKKGKACSDKEYAEIIGVNRKEEKTKSGFDAFFWKNSNKSDIFEIV